MMIQTSKVHNLTVEVANKTGVIAALLFNHIGYWVYRNRSENSNSHNGKNWVYLTVNDFNDHFPYLSVRQIRTGLSKLETEGLIETGCFNEKGYDKTKWYTLTQVGDEMYKSGITHTDDEGDTKYLDLFHSVWMKYPRRIDESRIPNSVKKHLIQDIGVEQLERCIERYKIKSASYDIKYVKHDSTFFIKGYKEFLDKKYGYEPKKPHIIYGGFNVDEFQ